MNKVIFFSLLIVILLTLSACNNNADTPVQNQTENPVNVELETYPNPPLVGDVELIFRIKDVQGVPIEGAIVDVSADHTDMQGMTMSGIAVDEGDGVYSITADFSMSGNWKVTVFLRKDGLSDYRKEFEIRIQ